MPVTTLRRAAAGDPTSDVVLRMIAPSGEIVARPAPRRVALPTPGPTRAVAEGTRKASGDARPPSVLLSTLLSAPAAPPQRNGLAGLFVTTLETSAAVLLNDDAEKPLGGGSEDDDEADPVGVYMLPGRGGGSATRPPRAPAPVVGPEIMARGGGRNVTPALPPDQPVFAAREMGGDHGEPLPSPLSLPSTAKRVTAEAG